MRVLAVDDQPEVLYLLDRVARSLGHEVCTAQSSAAALEAVGQQVFDIALVDYRLPDPVGIDVLAQVRARHPGCISILTSGSLDVAAVTDAVNRGEISRVIAKPFDVSTIVRAISEAIAIRKVRQRISGQIEAAELAGERAILDNCFADDCLELALQPLVSVADRSVYAYECLLRSSHPSFRGPLEVLSAVERHGMVDRLADTVARLARRRLDQIDPRARLFINLHPLELANPASLSARWEPLAPVAHRLVLEITERSKLDGVAWEKSVGMLRNAGFDLAVDDLGAGYSSLAALAQVAPTFMKVDMSIVRDIDSDLRKQRLLQLLCQFAQSSGAVLVAEGIETEREAAVVTACGADLLQGYLLGKPTLEITQSAAA